MNRETLARRDAQISEEAAEWFVAFRTGEIDAVGRRAFDTWIRSSPEYLRAYLEIAAIWDRTDALDAPRLDIETLTELARAEGNVISLERAAGAARDEASEGAEYGVSRDARVASRWRHWAVAASVLVVVGAAALLTWHWGLRAPTYVTEAGEERSLRLPDGSTVELNSRSRLRVRFDDKQRIVDLIEGQALFHVAKNPLRPFIVYSDRTRVRAVGTQFDVYRKPSGTVVTVVEGRVAVSKQPPSPALLPMTQPLVAESRARVLVSAGEQVTVTTQEVPRPMRINVAAATAWTQRQLVLEAAPLIEVAEEFNRYSARKLIIEDDGVPQLHLSGVFKTDPDFLIQYLRERPDITVRDDGTEIHIRRHAAR